MIEDELGLVMKGRVDCGQTQRCELAVALSASQ